ncbi:unnamed protein product, partial [Phaeothamnion confervicola]
MPKGEAMESLREAPVYRPSTEEFAEPLRYIEGIRAEASKYGVCKIVPPEGWAPRFVHQPDKLRFQTKQQELEKLVGSQRLEVRFSDALRAFLFVRGMPMERIKEGRVLRRNGKPVPLYRLFKACRKRGGSGAVSRAALWPAVAADCGVPEDEAAALREVYTKYLVDYESFVGLPEAPVAPDGAAAAAAAGVNGAPANPAATRGSGGRAGRLRPPAASLRGARPARSPSASKAPAKASTANLKAALASASGAVSGAASGRVSRALAAAVASAATAAAGAGRGLVQPGVSYKERPRVEHNPHVGDGLWRYFPASDRCLYGLVRSMHPKSSIVDYYESAAAAEAAGGVARPQLATLLANGKTAAQARLAFSGRLCEVCSVAGAFDAMAQCARCGCCYHAACFEPPLTLAPHAAEVECGMRGARMRNAGAAGATNTDATGRMLKYGFQDGGVFSLRDFSAMGDRWRDDYLKERRMPHATEEQLEEEFWRLVGPEPPKHGVKVLYGSDLDTSVVGSGFPPKNSPAVAGWRGSCGSGGYGYDVYGDCGYGGGARGGQRSGTRSGSQSSGTGGGSGSGNGRPTGENWNLNRLPTVPGSLLQHVGGDIKGVMVPWLYVGMAFSAFCWHNEDHYLYSINYLHWGAPKRRVREGFAWYGVAGADAEAFEAALQEMFPELFAAHADLLLQLVTMASPADLIARGVPVASCTQREGEFVITFPQVSFCGM